MYFKITCVTLANIIACLCIMASNPERQPNNTPPKVIITKPSVSEKLTWNTIVRYSISVSDKEDGSSEFDEITTNEVILKTVYLPDSAKTRAYINNEMKAGSESRALKLIKSSTCFNCHSARNKLIGPSFQAIAQRYTKKADSIKMLPGKVIKGSNNTWGDVKMPPNPEMKEADAKEIVQWILKTGKDPYVDYMPGLQGAFRTLQKPANNTGKGVYILTARYTDHGTSQISQTQLEGKDVIVLKCK